MDIVEILKYIFINIFSSLIMRMFSLTLIESSNNIHTTLPQTQILLIYSTIFIGDEQAKNINCLFLGLTFALATGRLPSTGS